MEMMEKDQTPPMPPASSAAPGGFDLIELWVQKLIEAVGRVSPFTRGYLIDAHPVSFHKGMLVIGFDPEFEDHLGLVDNSRNHTLLATKLAELGHPNAIIKFIKAEAPSQHGSGMTARPCRRPSRSTRGRAKAPPMSAKSTENATGTAPEKRTAAIPFNKDEFKNDPLIQKALEIFKGTIVEVRG